MQRLSMLPLLLTFSALTFFALTTAHAQDEEGRGGEAEEAGKFSGQHGAPEKMI